MVKKEFIPDGDRSFRVDLWVRTDDAQEIWCDVSVPEPGCDSYLRLGSASRVGEAVKKVESSKRSKWGGVIKKYKRVGVKAAPLVVETGQDFQDFLTTIESTSEGPSRARLIAQLSVTLAKYNVECVREAGRKACEANGL